jgi:hypothetical protein
MSDRAEFYDRYNANLGLGSGTPEAFTVVGPAARRPRR